MRTFVPRVERREIERMDADHAWTLEDGIAAVERRLRDRLQSREPLLTEISSYLVGSGGKRVRPAVTLLVYRACGGTELATIVDVATALELIHSATLLHDDIIDRSETRRGKPSALFRYGLAHTLVTGDFIFSRAFELCAPFDEQLIRWAAAACIALTEGEVMQSRFRHNPAVTLEDYLEIVRRKTASIFEHGSRAAASLAGACPELVEAMAAAGFAVGMTFQIVDDILDIEGTEASTGKPIGIDLRDGNPALPIVLALNADPVVRRWFAETELSEEQLAAFRQRIRASGAMISAKRLAESYAEEAQAQLALLPESTDKRTLLELVEQLVHRIG